MRQALALLLLLSGPALAEPLVSVCARAEVLDIVADDIARRGTATLIVPGDFGQVPTARPDTVRCAVRVSTRTIDTNSRGYVPLDQISIVEFSVRTGENGLFVGAVEPVR